MQFSMQTKKLQVLLLAAALLTTGVATESAVDPAATLETQQFTCVANLSVPDANLSGVVSFLTVTNCSVLLSNLQVSFNLRGDPMAFNGNYYADLRHNGKIAVLLNRVGRPEWFGFGYSDNGFDVVFDDHATNGDIHVYRTVVTPDLDPLTGVWAPDGRTNDVRTVVADDPRVSLLNSFVGEDPNGTWMLFVADVGAGGNGNLVSWGITVTGPRNPDAPFFTINPQDQQAPLGQDIVLQISLTGKDPIQMNWCKDGLPLSDDERNTVTTNQTLRIHNALLSDSGLYRAIASNEWGVVTSQVALVTVVPPPEFQWQPQSVTTNSGALAVFAAGISGTPPVGFQWFFNGTLLANATNQSLVFINVQSAQAGNYYLKVSNLGGSVTSQVVTLSLLYSLVTHGTEGGAIERHPDAPFYSSGSTVELLARPESNYVFTGWSGDLSGLSNPATLTLDSNKDVSAQFKRLCRLTVMVEGQGAIARDPAGDSFPEGQTVSLTAQPDAGWQFVEGSREVRIRELSP
jgi:subtilisin-like proprotein convertase family protein